MCEMFIELITTKASGEYEVPQVYLFEFDNRFSIFKEFVHYDFRSPLSVPGITNRKTGPVCMADQLSSRYEGKLRPYHL